MGVNPNQALLGHTKMIFLFFSLWGLPPPQTTRPSVGLEVSLVGDWKSLGQPQKRFKFLLCTKWASSWKVSIWYRADRGGTRWNIFRKFGFWEPPEDIFICFQSDVTMKTKILWYTKCRQTNQMGEGVAIWCMR